MIYEGMKFIQFESWERKENLQSIKPSYDDFMCCVNAYQHHCCGKLKIILTSTSPRFNLHLIRNHLETEHGSVTCTQTCLTTASCGLMKRLQAPLTSVANGFLFFKRA
ncbi:CLUMA_CG001092, isoform A [Clunio marinus]|uniref:CLUMA_CG001092, isoform A n=1 Tax=Clunio marinus TaxID=568069 RepID=A0A1J1HIB1_9DIPT|nr:CLUMA_CG001092, isoform A [Clunio marinus]